MWLPDVKINEHSRHRATNDPTPHIIMCPFEMWTHNHPEWAENQAARQVEWRKKVTHNIARLTVRLLLHSEERLATQLGAAGHADEAVDVEDLVHGSAASTFTHYVLSTAGTAPCGEEEDGRLRTDSTEIHR